MKPWVRGDLLVAATLLNNPDDDHAGRGRILQYGADLQPKGVLWTDATTHLIGGLKFDAQGVLWAFDSHAFVVLNIHPDGRVERRDFPRRAFSHVNFCDDGSMLLGEHIVGERVAPAVQARMKTHIANMPGTERLGDGHVLRLRADGTLVKEYATATHGGMAGFLGVTMSALSPDAKTLVYCSETGPRLMRYDLLNDRQLPDLQSFLPPHPPGPPPMFFGMAFAPDGTLYVLRGSSIHVVDNTGTTTQQIPLTGSGWATIAMGAQGRYAFISSFFTGEVQKIDLTSGAVLGSIQTGAVKSVAGLAEFRGGAT